MHRRTVVNIKALQNRSKQVKVAHIGKHLYRASSITNKFHYLVIVKKTEQGVKLDCNCKWGRNGEGCVHSLAVVRHILARRGKVPSFWTDKESAMKQKRKVIFIGDNLYLTARSEIILESTKEGK